MQKTDSEASGEVKGVGFAVELHGGPPLLCGVNCGLKLNSFHKYRMIWQNFANWERNTRLGI